MQEGDGGCLECCDNVPASLACCNCTSRPRCDFANASASSQSFYAVFQSSRIISLSSASVEALNSRLVVSTLALAVATLASAASTLALTASTLALAASTRAARTYIGTRPNIVYPITHTESRRYVCGGGTGSSVAGPLTRASNEAQHKVQPCLLYTSPSPRDRG